MRAAFCLCLNSDLYKPMAFTFLSKKDTAPIPRAITYIERILAVIVVVGVLVYAAYSVGFFFRADWGTRETFYELIYRVLLVTIGLELSRMLITHSFLAILELLAFVVARKMLKPDIETWEVFLGVLAFVAILAAYQYCIVPLMRKEGISLRRSEDTD
jgi:hypothetical protein